MNINRLNVYRRGLKVERLHTVPHIAPYNNGFHSCNAALIAHELCQLADINSASVMRYMLLHDVAEGYVGDTPANVKRDYPDIKHALDIAESEWEARNILDMPDLCIQEKDIAKVADITELGMYCLEELALGNTNLIKVLVNVVNYLEEYKNIKGVSHIFNHFVSRGNL